MLEALKRAIRLYKNSPREWKKLVKRAMEQDFSWNVSALKYLDIYERVLNKNG
jgi:starch synthase